MSHDGVVLLHGIARSERALRRLERALIDAGYRTLNLRYPSRRQDIQGLADTIEGPVRRFAERVPDTLHFVTHSMGGLVARAFIHRHRPARLGRVAMLAPPNRGSEVADLFEGFALYQRIFGPAGRQLGTRRVTAVTDRFGSIDYELGVIAGDRAFDPFGWAILPKPNDGKVSVAATKIDGMADHIVLPATHTFIMRSPVVIETVLRFLRHGSFAGQARRSSFPRLVSPTDGLSRTNE